MDKVLSSLEKILDHHEKFIRTVLEKIKDISPQLCVCKNNKIIAMLLVDLEREQIRTLIDKVAKSKPEWIVFMTEAFVKKAKVGDIETFRHGDLKKDFGKDKNIFEIIVIQAYTKEGKMMRCINKKTLERYGDDAKDFSGFLSIDDVSRVFWQG